MDAYSYGPKQQLMSYQHQHQQYLTNSRQQQVGTNKSHYSNRQQVQQHQSQQDQQSSIRRAGNTGASQQQALQNIDSSAGSTGSSEEQQLQLSSLSTATDKTISSQTAMISSHHSNTNGKGAAAAAQQHHLQMHHKQRQQQAQQQHHRQAALQSQSLTVPGKAYAKSAHHHHHHQVSSADNMTTSSSDHTINDDLHHPLAQGYGTGAAGRLTGSRFSADSSGSGGSQSGSRFLLGVLFTLAELLLFTSVFLWLYWSYQHDDGFSWQNDRKQQFNTHAALMLFGFVFLNGQAMLIYRSFQCCSKIYTKILHTILFVLATSAISLGLILGYTAQENVGLNNKPIMHFYSLHAWCGLATVGLFVLQFFFGFVSFLILLCCDSATSKFRAALLPIHKTFGLVIFSLAIATCLMGILQTARSRLR